jgi:hypothetical protein
LGQIDTTITPARAGFAHAPEAVAAAVADIRQRIETQQTNSRSVDCKHRINATRSKQFG